MYLGIALIPVLAVRTRLPHVCMLQRSHVSTFNWTNTTSPDPQAISVSMSAVFHLPDLMLVRFPSQRAEVLPAGFRGQYDDSLRRFTDILGEN